MDAEHVVVDVVADERIAVVTLDRPPVNAQDRSLRQELIRTFDALGDREDVRAVILTGSGEIFSAGADLHERDALEEAPSTYLAHNRITREAFFAVRECRWPVIAAINGPAIGAGYALAACADILVAADRAWVQMPELDRGLAGGAKFLDLHFSRSRSRLLFFTGRRIDADELYRLGVVDELTTSDGLLPTARGIARDIAAKSPLAIAKAKAAFNTVEELPLREGYGYEQSVTLELSKSADAREARRAYLEKRQPNYTGR
jgi:enoyl-CoA hydratase